MKYFARKKNVFDDKKGFTLIEMLIYVALVGIISMVLFGTLLFIIKVNNKIIALSRVNSNAYSTMERMTYEIINAQYVYIPTSNFINYGLDTSVDQLSLATEIGSSSNEDINYIDFYLDNYVLFIKKEGSVPIALNSSDVQITKLEFSYFKNGSRESIQIDIKIKAKNSSLSDSEVNLISTVALR
ncbi:MAG: type II secretion system protein [Candidatus Pacebacteria bacterium]|nr:type II secretion system protein [Candidatus Paceibacterota bacterium]